MFPRIKCWKACGGNEDDPLAQESPNWRGRGERLDCCWVQEYPPGTKDRVGDNYPHGGQLVGQLRSLIKVYDLGYRPSRPQQEDPPTFQYCIALVDTYTWKNIGRSHEVHGMIEVTRPRVPTTIKPRKLLGRKFYSLEHVNRSAHVVPAEHEASSKSNGLFYINNYIDHQQYNSLYNDDWFEVGEKRAQAAELEHAEARSRELRDMEGSEETDKEEG